MQQIKNFIVNNKLSFKEGTRNSDSVILAGYALYLNPDIDINDLIKVVTDTLDDTDDFKSELYNVFNFAKKHSYGSWWSRKINSDKFII